LDEVRGWWRYHHLFADLLRARLQRQQPDRIAVLHRNAAAWLEEHGLADEAIRHALAAGDTVWAARLIERCWAAPPRSPSGPSSPSPSSSASSRSSACRPCSG
jgi:ATP/maltotriose-dependent transcriptional regulator MalT